jgi:hypothetical protein
MRRNTSTDRSSATHWSRPMRIAMVILLLLAPLLLVELSVRVLIATDRLPVAAAHTVEFEITWTNLARIGTPDVLILGDSVSQQGMEPGVLSTLLSDEVGRPVSVFNASSPGGRIGVNLAMVEQLAREGRLPRVAIIGLYPGTLNNDLTFTDVFAVTPMGALFTACQRTTSLAEALDCQFGSVSAAWRWRGHPDRLLRAFERPVPHTIVTGGLHLRADGFREGRGVSLERLQAQLDGADLRKRLFAFSDEVAQRYVELVDSLRSRGVVVVAVAVPDTPALAARMERLEPGRRGMFRGALDTLQQMSGLRFVDPVAFGSWWGDGAARNFNHLSVRGAAQFTRQLWEMPDFHDPLVAGVTR